VHEISNNTNHGFHSKRKLRSPKNRSGNETMQLRSWIMHNFPLVG